MRTICVLAVALVLSTAARAAAEPPDVDAARHSLLWATRSDYRLAINLRRIGSVVALLGLTTATFAGLTYLTARAMCGASDFASSIGAGFGAGSGDGTVANGSGQVTGGGGQVAGTRPASPSSGASSGSSGECTVPTTGVIAASSAGLGAAVIGAIVALVAHRSVTRIRSDVSLSLSLDVLPGGLSGGRGGVARVALRF